MTTDTTRIPMPMSQAIDLKTGYPTREWYRYWNQPQLQSVSLQGTLSIADGGTGESSASAAFAALAPQTSDGSVLFYESGAWTGYPLSGLFSSKSSIEVTYDPVANKFVASLTSIANSGGGVLQKTAVDVHGLVIGTSPATSDDLPEGQFNLYDLPVTAIALTNLGAQIVVAVDGSGNAYTPNLANPVDLGRIAGVTLHAAAEGAPIQIVTQRSFTESAWNWSPGRIYCATTGGALTQTPPTSPSAIVEVARAISPTTIRVGIQPAIII